MSLKKNIVSLLGIQVVGYLVPLLQLPYLSRVLGAEVLGLQLFLMSIVTLAAIVTDFGFDISVSKTIAEGKNSLKELSEFLYAINIIKLFLIAVSLCIVIACVLYSNYFSEHMNILPLIISMVVLNGFRLNWLFQGIEEIYIYSRITIVTKLASILFIFIFVNNENDIYVLNIINTFQLLLALILTYFIVFRRNIFFNKISLLKIKKIFLDSLEYFISRVGVSLYSTLGSFFLGMFSGSLTQVAIYGVAEQLYKAGISLMTALSTPLIPYMARTKNYPVFFQITLLSFAITVAGSLIGYFFGEDIISIIYGTGFEGAEAILKIFMVTIIFSILGIHFGYPALIPLGKQRVANYSVFIGGIIQIIFISIVVVFNIKINACYMATVYLLCDICMFSIRFICFTKNYKIIH